MQWFKNLSIRTKIGGVFGLTLVLALLMSSLIFMLVSMSQLAAVAIGENDNLMVAVKDVRTTVYHYQLHKNPDALSLIDESLSYYHRNSDSLIKKLRMEESRRDLVKANETMDKLSDLAKQFIASGGDEAAQPGLYKAFMEKSDELIKLSEYARTERPKKLFKVFNTVKTVVFAINFFILLAGLLIGIMVARSISRDMKRSVEFVTAVAGGDLTAAIEINKKDEIGRLGGAMQEMARSLDQIVQRVRNNASEVATGSREIQASSESVAQSATEQAASVEEIAATIEEMMSSIKASALSAEEGRQKATGAINLVNENVELSRQMAQAMEEITNAAKHIREITDTVNQVAFQTNLLALNAAVEAARAGEHGKGFAVVAEEVRALAQRSADASREIKALIETTVNKVNAGSGLVTKVAGAMEEINVTTMALSQSMEEIAMAASEQSAGIEELNRAVTQVDSTTQSNAAVVEELAGNATSMLGTSDEMLDAVSMFKTSA